MTGDEARPESTDDDSGAVEVTLPHLLEVLRCGELELLGQLPYASNATLLTRVRHEEVELLAVYKPRRGERPLWDFPIGTLCQRECAAWVVDAALGWSLVPPTVLRDGPAGTGALQLYVDEDPDADLEDLAEELQDELRRVAAFDVIVNNADRKGGHCLIDRRGKLWAIDHGVCFNVDPKLRTVIWAFEGELLPDDLRADLQRFGAGLRSRGSAVLNALDSLLDADEIDMLGRRVDALTRSGRFPSPGPGRRHVPWPPW